MLVFEPTRARFGIIASNHEASNDSLVGRPAITSTPLLVLKLGATRHALSEVEGFRDAAA